MRMTTYLEINAEHHPHTMARIKAAIISKYGLLTTRPEDILIIDYGRTCIDRGELGLRPHFPIEGRRTNIMLAMDEMLVIYMVDIDTGTPDQHFAVLSTHLICD